MIVLIKKGNLNILTIHQFTHTRNYDCVFRHWWFYSIKSIRQFCSPLQIFFIYTVTVYIRFRTLNENWQSNVTLAPPAFFFEINILVKANKTDVEIWEKKCINNDKLKFSFMCTVYKTETNFEKNSAFEEKVLKRPFILPTFDFKRHAHI